MALNTHHDGGPAPNPGRPPGKAVPRTGQRGSTAAAAIYRELRADIVSLRRKPGEPIIEKHIAESFGVSRTPVREAILRLSDEGLVEIFPQSGTFVSRIPIEALDEASVIRKTLEQATARFAAERATRSQIAALNANLEQQREVIANGDRDGFHQADEAFHALIAEIAGYPGFWPITLQVKVQIDRCRRLTLPVPGRMDEVLAEHEAIVAAIAAHDPDAAVVRLGEHVDGLQQTIENVWHSTPLYFSLPEAKP